MANSDTHRFGYPNLSSIAWDFLRSRTENRSFVLVPDARIAHEFREACEALDPDLETHLLSPLETDLLRNRGPSLQRRMDRISFFTQAFAVPPNKTRRLFIVCADAGFQRAAPASFWKTETLYVKEGLPLSRTQLADRLVDLGYLSSELVESASQYALRGSIVDVFPPTSQHPIRIELFDDTVQSIRSFQKDSQRRIDDLKECWIPPCREFVFPTGPTQLADIRSRLRKVLDSENWDKPERDSFLDRIDQKSFFSTIDYWASLLAGESAPAKLSLPPFDAIIESAAIHHTQTIAHSGMEKDFLAARVEGEWVPPSSLFLLDDGASLNGANSEALHFSERVLDASSTNAKISGHARLADQLHAARATSSGQAFTALLESLRAWTQDGLRVFLTSPSTAQLERLLFVLGEYGLHFRIFPSFAEAVATDDPVVGVITDLAQGFIDPARKTVFLADEEIFGLQKKRAHKKKAEGNKTAASAFSGDLLLLDLKIGDLVVHDEHGIGRYLGMKSMNLGGIQAELVEIEYRESTKLLLPVTRLALLQKFSSGAGGVSDAPLDRLGGQSWEQKKSKAKQALKSIAGELLHLYSQRSMAVGPRIQPDPKTIEEFAATFAYTETRDQEQAIQSCLEDLRGPRPMDRLLCGDVGYGKTEVSVRAAHAAVVAGYQVAVLVPTTILASQHELTFKKRFEPLGYKVESLSRFKSTKQVKEALARLKSGELSIIVGTHKLLGAEVGFTKLGLLVIDEEQRFGVTHKEKIKRLKTSVHVLSMTATPIPRTLNMAMSGLKELSVITTPPQDRLSVRTHIAKKKPELIRDAIESELKRGGQVFYVHNRVQTILQEVEEIQALVPYAKVGFVHGQLDEEAIEARMIEFYEGRIQVLVATSIIESGLDVPNANTLIVDRADTFGLAQLYQIRGRVGRSSQRAYAYFLIPAKYNVTSDAEERLAVLESYQELGSGFHIASHDLEIRGAGDFLGRAQSGQIAAIGFDAYMELLQEAVAELKGEAVEHKIEPEINLPLSTIIPDPYIPETGLRLMFYRKLAASESEHDVDAIEKELEDRFGSLPESVRNLCGVMRIKCQLARLGVRVLNAGKNGYSLVFDPSTPVSPRKLVEAVGRYPTHFQISPDGKLLLKKPTSDDMMRGIEGALSLLESWVE